MIGKGSLDTGLEISWIFGSGAVSSVGREAFSGEGFCSGQAFPVFSILAGAVVGVSVGAGWAAPFKLIKAKDPSPSRMLVAKTTRRTLF
jgi:hypothetical protein